MDTQWVSMKNVGELSVNVGKLPRLSHRQRLAASWLAIGESRESVARHFNISKRTLERWLTLPHFHTAIEAYHREFHERAGRKLHGLLDAAIIVLYDNLHIDRSPQTALALLKMFGPERVLLKHSAMQDVTPPST